MPRACLQEWIDETKIKPIIVNEHASEPAFPRLVLGSGMMGIVHLG